MAVEFFVTHKPAGSEGVANSRRGCKLDLLSLITTAVESQLAVAPGSILRCFWFLQQEHL